MRLSRRSGFALTITLVLMVLIAIVVIAYLVSTRIERSTSSVYANRLRAKIQADSALATAIHLLKDNTRYGNYITAMPAPIPTPASIYTEIYRPTDTTSHAAVFDDYLRLDNGGGEFLVSRAAPSPSPWTSPGPDPRPTPDAVPSPLASTAPFALPSPSPALVEEQLPPRVSPTPIGNSYNFNQVVTMGGTTGRLVQSSATASPGPLPALGQWVNVRNSTGELIGRYAFFIEDESMKVNVNYVGNSVGGSNMRLNDLSTPLPAPTPASQIQEIDPSGILLPANRSGADTGLMNLGAPGSRLASRLTLGLLANWNSSFPDYTHLATIFSKDDDTTARGWQRLNLNALVTSTNKVSAATQIANWIHDAWTGPISMASLQTAAKSGDTTRIFGDDRLRQQIAANIVDYIAPIGAPTDMGDVAPTSGLGALPVIGIEKIPYIHAIEIMYQTSNSTYPTPTPNPNPATGSYTATVKMKIQFRFINLFESNLGLTNQIGTITVKGVPAITKNGSPVLDVSAQPFTINATDLKPFNPPTDFNVPAGTDGASNPTLRGVRTFQTDWLLTKTVPFTVPAKGDERQRFVDGTLNIQVLGKNGERLDVTQVNLKIDKSAKNALTGYYYGSNKSNGSYSSWGDFLEDATSSNQPQIASISLTWGNALAGTSDSVDFGDPRYRGNLIASRFENDGRTDATSPSWTPSDTSHPFVKTPDRISEFIDQAEISPRTHSFDWYDYDGDSPLAFIRNGPMINIGELGHVAACEYPWRSLYLQYPERPANSTEPGVSTDIPLRRNQSLDYVLLDLFRTQTVQPRIGAININSQQQLGTQQRALGPLFLGIPVGTQSISQVTPDSLDRINDDPGSTLVASVSNRRVVLASPFPDNGPIRPFFQPGELASVLSRLTNKSPGASSGSAGTTTDSRGSCSTVSYGVLRNNATTASEKVGGKINTNIQRDMQVEQLFREVSNSITTRGNVFRVLYVGQTIKDINKNGSVDSQSEVTAEYLGEAYVERTAIFQPNPSASPTPTPGTPIKTSDSTYKIVANRVITE